MRASERMSSRGGWKSKPASFLAAVASTGLWPMWRSGKKNAAGKSDGLDEEENFLFWGGEVQGLYERWRQASLLGDEVGCFLQYGMSLLAPERWQARRLVYAVRRCRASVRVGEFSVGALLVELGISSITPRKSRSEIERMELVHESGCVCASQ